MSRKTGKPSYTKPQPATSRLKGGSLVFVMLLPIVLAGVIGVGIGYAVAAPSGTDAAINEIRADEAKRDVAQVKELTRLARTTQEELGPVLSELDAALAAGEPAPADRVANWQQTMRRAVERHADSPSGMTATNVARGGLRVAVDGLTIAVDWYVTAIARPVPDQRALLDLVSRQRAMATTTWSIAAAQLDQINIDSGNGHQHVYLTTEPGSGAFTSDGAPEGATD